MTLTLGHVVIDPFDPVTAALARAWIAMGICFVGVVFMPRSSRRNTEANDE
jgi:hypothetical protein